MNGPAKAVIEPFSPDYGPGIKEVFILEKDMKDEKYKRLREQFDFIFYYQCDDDVYPWDYHEPAHTRKNRVPCRVCRGELLNFDKFTSEEIDYYMKARQYRKQITIDNYRIYE